MKLIGMLDSPYVRRTAITLQLLGLDFAHEALSVFRTFEAFRAINPVVKAPTLVCDDGTVLMDSTLIIDWAEARAGRSLMPAALPARQAALRGVGLALAACEKAVQLVYERELRPADKRHGVWVERVTGQLLAALGELEAELRRAPPDVAAIDQAGLTTAVTWFFVQDMVPGVAAPDAYPLLTAWSAAAEQLPAFRAAPHGVGVVQR
ncbi:MAG: glutathione S-transferase [Pelomonas sp.]|nr:glutathione S-transferase [Roseateles sp.]